MINIIIAILIILLLIKKIIEVLIKFKESYNNVHKFKCVVVNTKKSRNKGLMFRKQKLKKDEGMLFDFKKPQQISLWMKNTFIPLDAIFIHENGKILDLKENLKPKSKKSVSSNVDSKFVLEVNANTIQKNNIRIGDFINLKKIKKLNN